MGRLRPKGNPRFPLNRVMVLGGLLVFSSFAFTGIFLRAFGARGLLAWLQGLGFLLCFLGWIRPRQNPDLSLAASAPERSPGATPVQSRRRLVRRRLVTWGAGLVSIGYFIIGSPQLFLLVGPAIIEAADALQTTGWIVAAMGFLIVFTGLGGGRLTVAGLLVLLGIILGPNVAWFFGIGGPLPFFSYLIWTLSFVLQGVGFLIAFLRWPRVRDDATSNAGPFPRSLLNLLRKSMVTLGAPLVLAGYIMLGSLIWLVPASRYVTNPFLGIVATVGWVLSAIGFLLAFLGLAMTRLVEVE